MRPRSLLSLVALLGVTVAASPAAGAATVPGLDTANPLGQSSWRITGMPDLDQLRQMSDTRRYLPNEGKMYCAPTSATNILAVLGAMGQTDNIIDPSKDWQDQANYDDAVSAIYYLGRDMETDKDGGTTAPKAASAIQAHLNRRARVAGTRVWTRHAYTSYAPDAGDLVTVGKNGGLMTASYGFYEKGEDADGVYWDRTGGHVVAISAAWANSTGEVGGIYVHDPGTSSSLDAVQSTFADDYKTLGERAPMRLRYEGDFYTIYVTPYSTSGTRFLEGYIGVYPERLWTIRDKTVTRITPEPLLRDDPELDEFEIPTSGAADVAATPTGSLLVIGRTGQITEVGIGAGQARSTRRIGVVRGATQIASMPSGAIIAAGPGRVTVLPPEGKRQTLPLKKGQITDLAFDHSRNEIQVLMGGRTVVALTGKRQLQRGVKGGKARYLNVTATGVVPGRQIVTSAGRTATVSKVGVLRLEEKTWKLRPGTRVAAAWVMPDAVSPTPGIIDGGKAGDVWEEPVRPNLQVMPGPTPGSIQVQNAGPVAAGASVLEILVGDKATRVDVPALGPMERSTPQVPGCTGSFTATADATDQVAESVESDNRSDVTCGPPN